VNEQTSPPLETNEPPPPEEKAVQPSEAERPAFRAVQLLLPAASTSVTYALLTINVLIFLAQYASLYTWGFDLPAAIGIKSNEMIAQGQYWRLFTPMFLHGSIVHIAFNMYALYNLGRGLERAYGHGRFLLLYLLSGFAGNVISMLFTPSPSLGSSTAIFGLLAAEGIFFYHNRGVYGQSAQRGLTNIATIAAINLIIGLSPGIDNWGHLGGLLGGGLFAWLAGPRLQARPTFLNNAPVLRLEDSRQLGQVLLAMVIILVLFALIAAAAILY